MRLQYWILSGAVSAAMVLAAMPLRAAVHECIAAAPAPASYTWNFHNEANSIFQNVQTDVHQITDQVSSLEQTTGDTDLTWQTHSEQLIKLRAAVNDASSKLCRLEAIRRVLEPWQQNVVDKLAAALPSMVNSTEDAILFSNNHPQRLWTPTYQSYMANIQRDASILDQSLGNAVQYSNVSAKYRELRNDLGLKASS